MRIIDLLSTDRIALGAQISDKEQAIDKLELKTYLRGYVPCSIDAISLEDVIVIRLSEGSML